MNKINRIKELISILIPACTAYYKLDKPIMSDKNYDDLYLELEQLETSTNYIQSNSPTQKVQGEVLDSLVKVKHTELMLSAEKSKNIDDAIKFMNNQSCVLSWKLDGMSLILQYNNGELIQALTRGGGEYGELVTEATKRFANIPLKIEYKGYLEIRGEALITFADFERINEELSVSGEDLYVSPRNLVAGTVRQLDMNIVASRKPIFIAFGIVKCDKILEYKTQQLNFLNNLGFQVVQFQIVTPASLPYYVEECKNAISNLEYLTDGLIVEFNDIAYGKAQGFTGHHGKNIWAIKHADDTYPTKFRSVELNTTRTGTVSITGIFDEVNIDGVKVSRASLHNYDIFSELQLGVGDIVQVYRANSVIPQIHDNETRSGTYSINMICPSCNGDVFLKKPKTSRILFCYNPQCPAQLVDKISHAVGNDALNIIGLSSATIEKFIECEFIKEISDIYKLEQYKDEIVNMSGMGKKSYDKLIKSIDVSRDTEMYRVIYAMGIKNIGKSASKAIAKHFNYDVDQFLEELENGYDFTVIEDFGDTTNESLHNWSRSDKNVIDFDNLLVEVSIKKPEIKKDIIVSDNPFKGKKIYGTGSFANYKKEELKLLLENLGAEFTSGYAKSLDVLIVGSLKGSGKEDKAKKDGIKIIQEEEFISIINNL